MAAFNDEVVSFAEFRARIKGTAFVRDDARRCQHKTIVVDRSDGSVECEACGKSLSAFTTLLKLIEGWATIQKWKADVIKSGQEMRERAALTWRTYHSWRPHLQAAKAIEKSWRGKQAPLCPHCGRGLLPEDFVDGPERGWNGRDYELSLRESDKAKPVPAPSTKDGGT